MKKVLILLTIFLISCGSEEGTYDLHHPAEEVNGVSLVDCLVSKGWENIPTIELRGEYRGCRRNSCFRNSKKRGK